MPNLIPLQLKNRTKSLIMSTILGGLFVLMSSVANAQHHLLSGQLGETLSESSYTQTGFFRLTPDGKRVLFGGRSPELVLSEEFGRELYMVDIDGSDPVLLLDHATYGYVRKVIVSEDSEYAVVEAGNRLYSIHLETKNVASLANTSAERQFAISPDLQYVVYTGLFDSAFYSVPISGGAIERIDDVEFSTLDSSQFEITSDSQYVILRLMNASTSSNSLIKAPIRGGTNVDLLPAGFNDLLGWKLAPDGSSVLYQLFTSPIKLFSVNTTSLVRNEIAQSNGDTLLSFWYAPDSNRVVYTKYLTDLSSPLKVFETDVLGSSETELSSTMFIFKYSCGVSFSSNSESAIFCAQNSANETRFYKLQFSANPSVTELLSTTSDNLYSDTADDLKKLFVSTRTDLGMGDEYHHKLVMVDVQSTATTSLFDYTGNTVSCIDRPFSAANRIVAYCAPSTENNLGALFTKSGGSTKTQTNASELPLFFQINSDARYLVYVDYNSESGDETLRSKLISDEQDFLCFPVARAMDSPVLVCF